LTPRADDFWSFLHADLPKSVARRIVDRRMLHLIKMWLERRLRPFPQMSVNPTTAAE
jgi:hypothetical protein